MKLSWFKEASVRKVAVKKIDQDLTKESSLHVPREGAELGSGKAYCHGLPFACPPHSPPTPTPNTFTTFTFTCTMDSVIATLKNFAEDPLPAVCVAVGGLKLLGVFFGVSFVFV